MAERLGRDMSEAALPARLKDFGRESLERVIAGDFPDLEIGSFDTYEAGPDDMSMFYEKTLEYLKTMTISWEYSLNNPMQ